MESSKSLRNKYKFDHFSDYTQMRKKKSTPKNISQAQKIFNQLLISGFIFAVAMLINLSDSSPIGYLKSQLSLYLHTDANIEQLTTKAKDAILEGGKKYFGAPAGDGEDQTKSVAPLPTLPALQQSPAASPQPDVAPSAQTQPSAASPAAAGQNSLSAPSTAPLPASTKAGTTPLLQKIPSGSPSPVSSVKTDLLKKWSPPLVGKITSPFGNREHPIYKDIRFHPGVDIAGDMGDSIVSPANGIVVDVEQNHPVYGKCFKIDHGDGVMSFYGHCSAILVKPGQKVAQKSEIARVGQTGDSIGPHLHFEILIDDNRVDPSEYIKLSK